MSSILYSESNRIFDYFVFCIPRANAQRERIRANALRILCSMSTLWRVHTVAALDICYLSMLHFVIRGHDVFLQYLSKLTIFKPKDPFLIFLEK